MRFQSLKKIMLYRLQFIPFTWNTLLFLLLCRVSYVTLYQPLTKENSTDAQIPFLRLMAAFTGWVILALVVLSVFSALLTWLYYIWLRKNGKTGLQIRFFSDRKQKRQRQFMEARLPGAIKPLLGFIKGRLYYDNREMTEKFTLSSSIRKKDALLRESVSGQSRIQLPDIKEYQIKGGILFFEDLLRIISLPVPEQANGSFYQSPGILEENRDEVAPKRTETMDIRIDQLRKVEGELLNYKDFESGDDVRRIVWKVFAKNRDLVVRVPERMEPYASHLYFYASFYAGTSELFTGNAYLAEMLNFYKLNVWSVYTELVKKDWQVRYLPDQELHLSESQNDYEATEKIISNSVWQHNLSTKEYFSAKKGTVLVVSSLTNPKELADIVAECDPSTRIYYVQLSDIFRHAAALGWLKSLFFVPAPDRLSRLKSRWLFHPLRRQLLKNEKEIRKILPA